MASDIDGPAIRAGGFSESDRWPISVRKQKVAAFALGDRATGPTITLITYPQGAPHYRGSAHSHRSDTFRMAVGSGNEQFRDSPKWLGHGDFVLMDANDPYVETLGSDGMEMFLLTADRRGYPHGYQQKVDERELLAAWPAMAEMLFGKEAIWPVHENDSDPVCGIKVSFTPPRGERRLSGSFTSRDGWHTMSDGSEVAVILLADPDRGPAVILSRNQPNTVEIGHHRLGTDTFRLVLDGSVQIGEARYGPGQFCQTFAGQDHDVVVHGPGGSSQILVLADRADGLLTAESGESLTEATQWSELQAEVAALIKA
jgi:hypothetical protein